MDTDETLKFQKLRKPRMQTKKGHALNLVFPT